jgi:hypothetical protein
MVTFDITDLYVNIPIDKTINITKTLLTNKKIDNILIVQACIFLNTILKQNYLQFNGKFYQPNKGVAMGSPISGLIAEIFLQHYENHIIKSILDISKINFYNRYVDDIIIIFDSTNTNVNEISGYMNNLHKHLQFNSTEEEINTISSLIYSSIGITIACR